MIIKIKDETYKVMWRHNTEKTDIERVNGFTECIIAPFEEPYDFNNVADNQYYGVAICHEHDIYNKRTGRKVAFKRALEEDMALDRHLRKHIWEQYMQSQPKDFGR